MGALCLYLLYQKENTPGTIGTMCQTRHSSGSNPTGLFWIPQWACRFSEMAWPCSHDNCCSHKSALSSRRNVGPVLTGNFSSKHLAHWHTCRATAVWIHIAASARNPWFLAWVTQTSDHFPINNRISKAHLRATFTLWLTDGAIYM